MKTTEQLEHLFNPRSVAVVGASNTFGKWGFDMINCVLEKAGERRVYPINDSVTEVMGLKSYGSVADVPEPVDFAVIVVPFRQVSSVMRDCVKKGVKAVVVITGGLSEASEEGAAIEKEIVNIARGGGIRFVGPNCLGHFSTASGFFTILNMGDVKRGPIGLVSQSGTLGGSMIEFGLSRDVGFSKFVASGNEADLHLEDYLEYLAQDEETRVITLYIEGLREGRRFFKLAKEITRRKPIVAMKSGETKAGTKAARSHTAALSGSQEVYDAAFGQSGVIRVREVSELFDVAGALLRQPLPRGRRVGILTQGGGIGVVASDVCERQGLEVAPLSAATMERLNDLLPSRWSHGNPIDTVAELYVTFPCLWAMMEDENIDVILMIGGIGITAGFPPLEKIPPSMRDTVSGFVKAKEEEELNNLDLAIERMDGYRKPLIIAMPSMLTALLTNTPAFNKLRENGIMVYPTPERAVRVMAHLAWYSEYLKENGG